LGRVVKLRGGLFNDTQMEFSGGLGVRFSGPQKAPVLTAPRKPANADSAASKKVLIPDATITTPRINDLYKNLAGQYKTLGEAIDAPSVMIFPLKSNVPSAGTAFSQLLLQQFSMTDDFTVTPIDEKNLVAAANLNSEAAIEMAQRVGSTLILIGSVEKIDNSYLLNARLLETEAGKILANAYEEFPAEALQDPNKKSTISELDNNRSSENMERDNLRNTFSKTDIGLDYSFSTRNELGLIHTVSLRIFY
jgi:TolB-like protein